MNTVKRLDEIGREEGGVFDVEKAERERAERREERRRRDLNNYFIATKIMRPFEDPIGYFKRVAGGVVNAVSGVVGMVYPNRARCGTNDLDEE